MNVDHRVLGRELELFATSPLVGAGLPLWLPDGAIIRDELESLAAEEAARSGCHRVHTPVLAKRELFELSGHWGKFSADMFPEIEVGGESFVLRPANCPHHTQVYAARGRSYRDLPFRVSELGSMFRSELSGVLGGLSRVRQISLDDAHAFCTPEQVSAEVVLALQAIARCYGVLGVEVLYYRLSLRGPGGQYLGRHEQWELAQDQLRAALGSLALDYVEAEGEAAFYGPKIDVQVADAQGREETLSTVQVDFNQPERFGLEYTGEDGARHRPVMIHRGLLGSMERLTALLIELYQGRLPPWLAPVQVSILPVDEQRHQAAAEDLLERLLGARIRARIVGGGSLGRRIRTVRQHRDPYLVVLGDAEVRDGMVNVDLPASGHRAQMGIGRFVDHVVADVRRRVRSPSGPVA
ncbi:threonine--tRNA ligase [Amycolatopsis sp. H20-H5]|uniref:threonine--tRNA ligase n=1 Tax=Amycolatopsis sp. H20-H5 TaxID=3046309 RepID=UPI002DB77108|nr:threonine--tRNA ligase [Amycolatopsis sp. H20-H5]MEC3980357.1 threonine--tRNA ligase [Amycolatopsis sp. H20-H5]